jgi:hypothetical protein
MKPPRILAQCEGIQPAKYTIETDVCTIGRSSMCQIVIPYKTISRLHAKIEQDGSRYVLFDTNSANGTFVNGCRIREAHLLQNQDLVGLSTASALLRFEDPDSTVHVAKRLRYDRQLMTFYLNQQPVHLTPAQFRLLHHLFLHMGSVCSRESCAEAIWGRAYDPGLDASALDRIISDLRGRLRNIDQEANLIETRRGQGYVLNL